MDVAALAKVKGDMAGEIEGIAPLFVCKGDLVHGPALHDPGIPVDEHAALHIGAADKAGTINAPARFAAPAVLGAQILFRLRADGIPERFLAAVVPRLQCLRHQLSGGNIPGLGQRVIKGQPLPLGEYGGHLKPHRLQRHVPDIAGAAIQQGHLGPAGVGQGFLGRFGQAAEQAAPLQLQHPHPLHLGQAEHIGGTAHQHQRLGQVVPQRILADKFQRIPPDKAVVAVKGDHLGHLRGEGHSLGGHAAGGGAHLTGLTVQALVPDGGNKARLTLFGGLGQVVNGHDRPGKYGVLHHSVPSNKFSSSSGFMRRMAPSALPVTVSARSCLACCSSTIFSSMVSWAMSLYTCTGFCWPMR